mmetsp:Transcript_5109/g.7470  ORF Transcript_5109/g.7470 Transcript_5109/m.7470 type:complete len:232 (+) Transcript_5109:37-732(+)
MKGEMLKVMYGAGRDIDKIVSRYDELADSYHAIHNNGSWIGPNKVAEVAASLIDGEEEKRQVEILDFGAGTGLSGMAMKNKGFSTIDALDVSKGMVDVAQAESNGELYRNVIIGILKENDDLVKQESYAMVVSMGCIGTHTDADEVYRIMPLVKPGGYILYTIKSEANESESFQKLYASLKEHNDIGEEKEEEKNNTTNNEWKVVQSDGVGPLNVDHPSVHHSIVVLQRMP